MSLHAIITGDIVSSGKIKPAARQKLLGAVNTLMKDLKKKWISSYETYRGDSLQCSTALPGTSLRVALIIRSFLKAYTGGNQKINSKRKKQYHIKGYFAASFDIRLSIGIGKVDFINKKNITSSDGEAFRLSGNALDELKNSTQRLAVKTYNKNFNEQIEPSILLLDALMQKWTQNQAELVYYKLQNKKEEEIAKLLRISQSAVNQRTKTAQWNAIEKLITYFERVVQNQVK